MDPNSDHILLRSSWAKAAVDKTNLARTFYSRLFKIAPETEALFKNDMLDQGRKLVATLDFIIDTLDDPDMLLSAAEDLAVRHVSYNVSADQYAFVGQALIETFQDILGDQFDPQTRDVWLATYETLSNHMITKAYH